MHSNDNQVINRRRTLGLLVASLMPTLEIKNITPGNQPVGAFLIGNQRLRDEPGFAQEADKRGQELLANFQTQGALEWQTLADIINSIVNLHLPEVTSELPGRLIGIMLLANAEIATNPQLGSQFEQAARSFYPDEH